MNGIEIGQRVATVRPVHRFKTVTHEAGYRFVKPARFAWLADRVYQWLMRIGALKVHHITEQVYVRTEYRSEDERLIRPKVWNTLQRALAEMWPLKPNDFVVVCGPEDLMEVRKELGVLGLSPVGLEVRVRYGHDGKEGFWGKLTSCYGTQFLVLPYVRGMVAVPRYMIERKEK